LIPRRPSGLRERGRILLADPLLQRFTGRSAEELVGTTMFDVVVQPEERDWRGSAWPT
jgi:PAS domain S-box-containing protein